LACAKIVKGRTRPKAATIRIFRISLIQIESANLAKNRDIKPFTARQLTKTSATVIPVLLFSLNITQGPFWFSISKQLIMNDG
jgi:hypothetical protein